MEAKTTKKMQLHEQPRIVQQLKNSNTDTVHMECVNQGAHEILDGSNINFRFCFVFVLFFIYIPSLYSSACSTTHYYDTLPGSYMKS